MWSLDGIGHCDRLGFNSISAEGHVALAASLRLHPGNIRELDGVDLSQADEQLPLEMKQKDNLTVLNYYRDLQSSAISRRCRVLLLGHGGAGKTTLANRLVKGAPADPTSTTHGVLQRTVCLGIVQS